MLDKLKLFSLKPEAYKLDNGNTVFLRRITAAERLEWFEYLSKESDKSKELELALNHQLKLLALAISDEDGNRLFKDNELPLLQSLDCITVQKLSDEVMKLNGFGSGAEDVEKKAESTGTN